MLGPCIWVGHNIINNTSQFPTLVNTMCINPWKGQDSGAGWSVSGMGVNQLNNVCSSVNIQMMQMGWQIGKNFRMWPGRPIPTQIITFIGVQRRFDSGDSRYSTVDGLTDREMAASLRVKYGFDMFRWPCKFCFCNLRNQLHNRFHSTVSQSSTGHTISPRETN